MNHASRKFWEHYSSLPPDVRKVADERYRLFENDPRHPSVRLKRVGRYWVVRLGAGYRAVGVDVDDGILWIWIGPHDAYESRIRS
ncbi:MAG: hypothetical protein WDM81_17265 [Rhizomicrobium sp.]